MTPNPTERCAAAIAALALLAPAAAGAAAQPRFEQTSRRYELGNDEISVWFQGKKPLLKVFPADDESRAYQLHFLRVAEFVDDDGDRAHDENETEALLNLARADAYNVSVETDPDAVHVELTTNQTLRDRGGGPLDGAPGGPLAGDERRGNVTLRFHAYASNRTVETANGTTTVQATEVKFDVEVNHWDWAGNDSRLAFVAELPASNDTEAEAQEASNRVTVARNGTTVGYAAWQDDARVTDENGTETVDVVPSYREPDNGTVQVSWAYDATGYDTLLHDPTMGVTSAEAEASEDDAGGLSDVPAPGAAAAAAALVGVAAARRLRRP